jgi:hypothetical protein
MNGDATPHNPMPSYLAQGHTNVSSRYYLFCGLQWLYFSYKTLRPNGSILHTGRELCLSLYVRIDSGTQITSSYLMVIGSGYGVGWGESTVAWKWLLPSDVEVRGWLIYIHSANIFMNLKFSKLAVWPLLCSLVFKRLVKLGISNIL